MKEKIIYDWKDMYVGNFDIIIKEDFGDDSMVAYRDENGVWSTPESVTTFPEHEIMFIDFEKCYQIYKREEKLKRICHGH